MQIGPARSSGNRIGSARPIAHEDAAFGDRPRLEQLERDAPRHRGEKGSAGAEQYRMDVEADLVDRSGLDQRRAEDAAAHDEDVSALLSLEIVDEGRAVLADQG